MLVNIDLSTNSFTMVFLPPVELQRRSQPAAVGCTAQRGGFSGGQRGRLPPEAPATWPLKTRARPCLSSFCSRVLLHECRRGTLKENERKGPRESRVSRQADLQQRCGFSNGGAL